MSEDDFSRKLYGGMASVVSDYRSLLPPWATKEEILVAMEAGGVHTLSQLDSHFRPMGLFATRGGRILVYTRDFGRVTSREFDVRHVTNVFYKPGIKSDELKVSVAGDVFTYYFVKPRGAGAAFQLYVSKLQQMPSSRSSQLISPLAPERPLATSAAPDDVKHRLRSEMFIAAADMARGMLLHADVEQVLHDLEPSYVELPDVVLRGARVTYLLLRDRPFEEASRWIVGAIPNAIGEVEGLTDLWEALISQSNSSNEALLTAAGVSADVVLCFALAGVAHTYFKDAFGEGGNFEDLRARANRIYGTRRER